ncbi:MAG: glycosyltransferase [Pirellulaceae bacterium]
MNTHASRRSRVLQISYACHPGMNSEPGVGWNRAVQSAKYCDTWVICELQYSSDIERYLSQHGPVAGLHFFYVRTLRLEWLLMQVPGCFYLSYHFWHLRAQRIAKRLHQQHQFDLVHQVGYCGYREPGYGWKLKIPFIWGPVGGTQNLPVRFTFCLGGWKGIGEWCRSLINSLQMRTSRRVFHALRVAKVVIAANSTNQADLSRMAGRPVEQFFEAGCSPEDGVPERSDRSTLRLLWSGQLEAWKAFPLLLRSLARQKGSLPFELTVIGQGSQQARWQSMSNQLGLAQHIRWLGALQPAEARLHFASAHALVFTSLRDTTGSALFQALEVGLPIVCLDHQGAKDIVTSACGIKVPVESPQQVVQDLASALHDLYHLSNEDYDAMTGNALRRARELSWERLGERINHIYDRVLGRSEATSTDLADNDEFMLAESDSGSES